MGFTEEPGFDVDQYNTWLRRIHYDDRDVVMYENMLNFLWQEIIQGTGSRPEEASAAAAREDLLDEYSHWNLQMIDKCYYHMPHDLPYVNIRRAYQSVICLFQGDIPAGLDQLALIGKNAFKQDGKAPKLHMTKQGRVFLPVSRLFLIYNYAKAIMRKDPDRLPAFKEDYPFAFYCFDDGRHEEHDAFLKEQMETHKDEIFYPEFERIYKTPGREMEFYLYFDPEKGVPLHTVL